MHLLLLRNSTRPLTFIALENKASRVTENGRPIESTLKDFYCGSLHTKVASSGGRMALYNYSHPIFLRHTSPKYICTSFEQVGLIPKVRSYISIKFLFLVRSKIWRMHLCCQIIDNISVPWKSGLSEKQMFIGKILVDFK